ncbi:hypothetical protein J8273_2411 [Carpediemonas membranifera]|uniref:Uncharacterized protein n=1 Tax=Carpediemonas membranifera TaxID=201153 RepID=A0A8J6B9L0_9EUKA|nr:hypothetical protein J8273_2411 [Carpediemonas membranifera]|eukprot:KAG9396059.1 hypothetical protein J8273_2411 [Carpediemonas membranifera]
MDLLDQSGVVGSFYFYNTSTDSFNVPKANDAAFVHEGKDRFSFGYDEKPVLGENSANASKIADDAAFNWLAKHGKRPIRAPVREQGGFSEDVVLPHSNVRASGRLGAEEDLDPFSHLDVINGIV